MSMTTKKRVSHSCGKRAWSFDIFILIQSSKGIEEFERDKISFTGIAKYPTEPTFIAFLLAQPCGLLDI